MNHVSQKFNIGLCHSDTIFRHGAFSICLVVLQDFFSGTEMLQLPWSLNIGSKHQKFQGIRGESKEEYEESLTASLHIVYLFIGLCR